MKKLILTSAAILMGMTSAAMAADLPSGISINHADIGNTDAKINIFSTPSYMDTLPNPGEIYGAINVGATVQQTAYQVSVQNLDLSLGLSPEPFGNGTPKEIVFFNVGTQYTPTFTYPATVKNITETTESYELTVNWNDDDNDVEFDWPW